MKITVNNQQFTVTLVDNEAAHEFLKLLPVTLTMHEHNGNEKYHNLSKSFPGKASNPGRVQAGDLMKWSSNTLVLFYAGGSTSYSYIRLGRVDNTSGLLEALGKGSVKITFESL